MKVSPVVEASLGLNAGELSRQDRRLHQAPAPRRSRTLPLMLWSMQERTAASIRTDFRMRHADNSYRWFELEAASVPDADRRAMRCVGLMRDVTDAKRAQERLMHDAVHDSLTGLPNRELLLDRLGIAAEARQARAAGPAGAAVHRHRQVQERERLVWPGRRRQLAADGGAPPAAQSGPAGYAGARRRRPVRLSCSSPSPSPQELAMLAEQVRRSLRRRSRSPARRSCSPPRSASPSTTASTRSCTMS